MVIRRVSLTCVTSYPANEKNYNEGVSYCQFRDASPKEFRIAL
jgi:hypothetical protein